MLLKVFPGLAVVKIFQMQHKALLPYWISKRAAQTNSSYESILNGVQTVKLNQTNLTL